MASSESLFTAAREALLATGEVHYVEEEILRTTAAAGATAMAPVFMGILLRRALAEHAAALIKSAEASEKHAASVKWATWALVVATAVLAVVSLGIWLVPIR